MDVNIHNLICSFIDNSTTFMNFNLVSKLFSQVGKIFLEKNKERFSRKEEKSKKIGYDIKTITCAILPSGSYHGVFQKELEIHDRFHRELISKKFVDIVNYDTGVKHGESVENRHCINLKRLKNIEKKEISKVYFYNCPNTIIESFYFHGNKIGLEKIERYKEAIIFNFYHNSEIILSLRRVNKRNRFDYILDNIKPNYFLHDKKKDYKKFPSFENLVRELNKDEYNPYWDKKEYFSLSESKYYEVLVLMREVDIKYRVEIFEEEFSQKYSY